MSELVTCATCGRDFDPDDWLNCFNLITQYPAGNADEGWYCSLPCIRHDLLEVERVVNNA